MHKNIILIPPCFTYGDCLSVIGLLNYLLEYYEKVHFYIKPEENGTIEYYKHYFSNDPLFEKRIFICLDPKSLIETGAFGEYHVCNVNTGDWKSAKTDFIELQNIDKEYYFNDLNPIYNKLPIPEIHRDYSGVHLPNKKIEINHIIYYKLVGLNNRVRMDYFNYVRNPQLEHITKERILREHNIGNREKYNIINDPIGILSQTPDRIKNNYKTININFIAQTPGYLCSLLEGAETIHFVEGSNVNFFYHCQYKNIISYDKEIYFHIWARNRSWEVENMMLDKAPKMMEFPRLRNWKFINE
jgi:hypothetical protein